MERRVAQTPHRNVILRPVNTKRGSKRTGQCPAILDQPSPADARCPSLSNDGQCEQARATLQAIPELIQRVRVDLRRLDGGVGVVFTNIPNS